MKKNSLLLFVLAFSLPAFSSFVGYVPPSSTGGGSGAVDSVNGKTGTVVLSGSDLKVNDTTTTNVASHLANKVDKQYTAADDNKVLTVDPSDHKVRPMSVSSSSVRFYHVFPSSGAAIDVGEAGYAVASRGNKSITFTFDQNGNSTPVSNVGDDITLGYDKGPKKLIVGGDSPNEYFLTIITE